MTALLGLLAVAGFQNRDKITEMLRGSQGSAQGSGSGASYGGHELDRPGAQTGGLGGLLGGAMGGSGGGLGGSMGGSSMGGLGGLLGSLGGAGAGGLLSRGLGELMERFQQTGHKDTVDSWVSPGPNRQIEPNQLQQAIGDDTLAELSAQTGLPREELIARLSRELPDAVDRYTPDGRLPDTDGDGVPDQPGQGQMPRMG
jgi:uncharacterized protein YidB (DUF937 family)